MKYRENEELAPLSTHIAKRYHEEDGIIPITLLDIYNMLNFHDKTREQDSSTNDLAPTFKHNDMPGYP